VFEPLDRAHIRRIVDIQVGLLADRLAARKLTLELSDEAREYLANAGYDPAYGARPLRRLLQRELQDPLALALLSGEIHDGDTVAVTVAGGGLSIAAA
jgi:ATP-dependent Clp protease ATP-binding subunit ClpB